MPTNNEIYGSGMYGGDFAYPSSNITRGIYPINQGAELVTLTFQEISSAVYDIIGFEIIGFIGRKTL
jgi:hypothetical protein